MHLYKILKPPRPGSSLSSVIWLWFFFAVTTFIKLWLVASQHLTALGGAVYDDRLFMNIAADLLNNKWLGIYSNMTLVKGPFYPMWIAAVSKSGIPLLLAQHILYIAACMIFVIAVKPVLRSSAVILVVFIVLLFNPMSYTTGVMTQVTREGIYPALSVFVIAFAVGLCVRHSKGLLSLVFWSAGLGLTLAALWLTREEGVWIIPAVLVLAGFGGSRILLMRPLPWRKIFLYLLPFVIWLTVIAAVSGVNKMRYGIFAISELKSSPFLAAYGALLRVKQNNWKPTIPVPEDVIERVYKVSPAFSELRQFFDGDIGKRWGSMFKNLRTFFDMNPEFTRKLKAYLSGDATGIWSKALFDDSGIHGGWFVWAFRETVAAAGYHTSGRAAADYYLRLANEVNAACADGRLVCGPERASLMPPFRREYAYPFMETVIRGAVYLAGLEGFAAHPEPSYVDEGSLKLFRGMTREHLSLFRFQLKGWAFSPGAPVDISVRKADGGIVRSHVPLLLSPDVYRHFLAKGMDIPNSLKARFDVSGEITGDFLPCMSTYYLPCYLHIDERGHLIKRVPIDWSEILLDDGNLHLHVEFAGPTDDLPLRERLKIGTLNKVGVAYQYGTPFFAALSLIVYALGILMIMCRKRGLTSLWIINTALFIALITRLFILSLIHITSFPVILPQYLAPCYPLLFMFIILSLADFFIEIIPAFSRSKER